VFCNQHRISGCADSPVTGQEVQATVALWLDRCQQTPGRLVQVAFYGGSFTGLTRERQQELLGAVAPFVEQGRVQAVRLSTRPDYIDSDGVAFLQDNHVSVVELGVQSMDNRVLAAAQRGHTAEDVQRAMALLGRAGMETGIQLLLGLAGDSRRSLMQTVREVIELQPAFVRIYPLLVVKNSQLASLYRHGEYRPLSLEMAVLLAAWMKERFDRAAIRVVRMGLQAGPELEASLLAGPWHPSFGELVSSRLMLRQTRKLMLQAGGTVDRPVVMTINPKDQSVFRGICSKNIRRLEELELWQRIRLHTEPDQPRHTVSYRIKNNLNQTVDVNER
jgi:histone acetyltransferase (RNA polymerase elongator complex component)